MFGHVHYRKRVRLGETEFVCGCLGDREEWRHPDNIGGSCRTLLQRLRSAEFAKKLESAPVSQYIGDIHISRG
ncbi:hypothetical protein [Paenibacillus sp. A3]|uniref:hypothetical protein n=1 Tax=Paenibacillus sp. A3 TaxID=1337054 RepID=UPI000A5E8E6F|nr:hypothetical protein [Paenibacillus sp. A3]